MTESSVHSGHKFGCRYSFTNPATKIPSLGVGLIMDKFIRQALKHLSNFDLGVNVLNKGPRTIGLERAEVMQEAVQPSARKYNSITHLGP